MKLSVVIPCYNEAKNIPLILKEYDRVIKRNDIEIILVNNNSSDDTKEILIKKLKNYSFARSIFEEKPGYGSAILAGLKIAKGDYIGWTHGDMQTPPKDIIRALDIIELNKNDKKLYLKGVRKGRSLFDNIFTWGMSFFETIYMGKFLWDINAQPNIFHRTFFEKWINPPYDFSLDLYALYIAKKYNLKIKRFPVEFKQRIHGQSKWNVDWKSRYYFIKRTLIYSFNLKKNITKTKITHD